MFPLIWQNPVLHPIERPVVRLHTTCMTTRWYRADINVSTRYVLSKFTHRDVDISCVRGRVCCIREKLLLEGYDWLLLSHSRILADPLRTCDVRRAECLPISIDFIRQTAEIVYSSNIAFLHAAHAYRTGTTAYLTSCCCFRIVSNILHVSLLFCAMCVNRITVTKSRLQLSLAYNTYLVVLGLKNGIKCLSVIFVNCKRK